MHQLASRRSLSTLFAAGLLCLALAPTLHAAGTSLQPDTAKLSLKQCMKQMGRDFKMVKRQVLDAAKNKDTAQRVADMIQLATQAQTLTPPHIAQMPTDQQAGALAAYKAQIGKLIDHLKRLHEELMANGNAAARRTVIAIERIMKQGHERFAPRKHR